MKKKKMETQKKKTKKKLEKPLKLDMTFEEAIKRIVNTKVKKKK